MNYFSDLSMLLWILVGLIFLIICLNWLSKKLSLSKDKITTKSDLLLNEYKKRYQVMNHSEMSLYQILVSELDEYYIFPKMRIADILETVNGEGYYKRRNKILPKHVDFLVCNKNFEPVLAIELDGGSHNNPNRMERDKLVDSIFAKVDLPLKRINVGVDFRGSSIEIYGILKAR